MTWEAWFTLAVIAVVVVALVRNWGPIDAVLLGGAVLVGLAGIITPEEVFLGFVNPGTLTIAALFVVASAMRETGSLNIIAGWIFGSAKSERSALARMFAPVAAMSAFMNNTPIVAMLMPIVGDWCRARGISPSRLLMPLSFIAILGGACTLVGTSTNLVVNGLIIEAARKHPELQGSLDPLGLFEFAYVGIPFVLVGGAFLLSVGRVLLPKREDLMERLVASPREYLADMKIQAGCRLIGQGVEEAGMRRLTGLFLVEIVRGDRLFSPVSPDERFEEGDILTFSGVVRSIVDLERIEGLVPVSDKGYEERAEKRREESICEAVISATSPLIGKNVREANFRAVYNSAVIAAHRGGERIDGRIGDIVLRAGDTLLLQSGPHFVRAYRNSPDFYLVSDVEESRATRHDKMLISVGLMVLLIGLIVSNAISIVLAAYLVAGLLIVTRCISASVARSSIDYQTLITIAAALALGRALENSGAGRALAQTLVGAVDDLNPHILVLVIYVLTGLFAALVSSKAAAVLMFPIALEAALAMGVEPKPLIMAVAFAAATTLFTPWGYPTNLMVYGPGGYRSTDFMRVGIPLSILLAILAAVLIPFVWPL